MKTLILIFLSSLVLATSANAELIDLVASKVREKFPLRCEKTIKAEPRAANIKPEAIVKYCDCGTEYLVKNTDNLQWIKGYADANKNPLPWLRTAMNAAEVQCKHLLK